MSDTCFVYVIAIEGQDLCKVGISNSPRARLAQLMTGSPFQMRLVRSFNAIDRETALMLEGGFHKALREHRSRGEWFTISADEAIELMAINYYALLLKHFEFDQGTAVAIMEKVGVPFDLACWVANTIHPIAPNRVLQ